MTKRRHLREGDSLGDDDIVVVRSGELDAEGPARRCRAVPLHLRRVRHLGVRRPRHHYRRDGLPSELYGVGVLPLVSLGVTLTLLLRRHRLAGTAAVAQGVAHRRRRGCRSCGSPAVVTDRFLLRCPCRRSVVGHHPGDDAGRRGPGRPGRSTCVKGVAAAALIVAAGRTPVDGPMLLGPDSVPPVGLPAGVSHKARPERNRLALVTPMSAADSAL